MISIICFFISVDEFNDEYFKFLFFIILIILFEVLIYGNIYYLFFVPICELNVEYLEIYFLSVLIDLFMVSIDDNIYFIFFIPKNKFNVEYFKFDFFLIRIILSVISEYSDTYFYCYISKKEFGLYFFINENSFIVLIIFFEYTTKKVHGLFLMYKNYLNIEYLKDDFLALIRDYILIYFTFFGMIFHDFLFQLVRELVFFCFFHSTSFKFNSKLFLIFKKVYDISN